MAFEPEEVKPKEVDPDTNLPNAYGRVLNRDSENENFHRQNMEYHKMIHKPYPVEHEVPQEFDPMSMEIVKNNTGAQPIRFHEGEDVKDENGNSINTIRGIANQEPPGWRLRTDRESTNVEDRRDEHSALASALHGAAYIKNEYDKEDLLQEDMVLPGDREDNMLRWGDKVATRGNSELPFSSNSFSNPRPGIQNPFWFDRQDKEELQSRNQAISRENQRVLSEDEAELGAHDPELGGFNWFQTVARGIEKQQPLMTPMDVLEHSERYTPEELREVARQEGRGILYGPNAEQTMTSIEQGFNDFEKISKDPNSSIWDKLFAAENILSQHLPAFAARGQQGRIPKEAPPEATPGGEMVRSGGEPPFRTIEGGGPVPTDPGERAAFFRKYPELYDKYQKEFEQQTAAGSEAAGRDFEAQARRAGFEEIKGGKTVKAEAVDQATDALVGALKEAKEGRAPETGQLPKENEKAVREASKALREHVKLAREEHWENLASESKNWNRIFDEANKTNSQISDATLGKIFRENPAFHNYFAEEFEKRGLGAEDKHLDAQFENFKAEMTKEAGEEVAQEARAKFKSKAGGVEIRERLAKDIDKANSDRDRAANAGNDQLRELHEQKRAILNQTLKLHDSITGLYKFERESGRSTLSPQDSGLLDHYKFLIQQRNQIQSRIDLEKLRAKGPNPVGAQKTPEEDVNFNKSVETMTSDELKEEYAHLTDSIDHPEVGPEQRKSMEIRMERLSDRYQQLRGEMNKPGPKSVNAARTPPEDIHYNEHPATPAYRKALEGIGNIRGQIAILEQKVAQAEQLAKTRPELAPFVTEGRALIESHRKVLQQQTEILQKHLGPDALGDKSGPRSLGAAKTPEEDIHFKLNSGTLKDIVSRRNSDTALRRAASELPTRANIDAFWKVVDRVQNKGGGSKEIMQETGLSPDMLSNRFNSPRWSRRQLTTAELPPVPSKLIVASEQERQGPKPTTEPSEKATRAYWESFIKNNGNLNAVAKDLGISYSSAAKRKTTYKVPEGVDKGMIDDIEKTVRGKQGQGPKPQSAGAARVPPEERRRAEAISAAMREAREKGLRPGSAAARSARDTTTGYVTPPEPNAPTKVTIGKEPTPGALRSFWRIVDEEQAKGGSTKEIAARTELKPYKVSQMLNDPRWSRGNLQHYPRSAGAQATPPELINYNTKGVPKTDAEMRAEVLKTAQAATHGHVRISNGIKIGGKFYGSHQVQVMSDWINEGKSPAAMKLLLKDRFGITTPVSKVIDQILALRTNPKGLSK